MMKRTHPQHEGTRPICADMVRKMRNSSETGRGMPRMAWRYKNSGE
jgi:hypothetical protein